MENKTIGALVAEDYRRAEVFKKHGIDFCCGGGKTVHEVCEKKGVNYNELEKELEEIVSKSNAEDIKSFNEWPLDKLADYIVENHHSYVQENVPLIMEFAQKVAKVHGHANPEVIEIANLFRELASELEQHMVKEERILFPYIKQLSNSSDSDARHIPPFQTVKNPIRMMEMEHDTAGEIMRKISELSSNYTPPEHACNTYRVEYFKLKEFEDDLHRHIHLENNILFPKAIELESTLLN